MQTAPHPDQEVYLLARISDDLATMDACTTRERGVRVAPSVGAGDPTFVSKTYQIAFQLRKGEAQGGSIELNWALRDGSWKIVAFDLLTD
jgi:hypothetical protein